MANAIRIEIADNNLAELSDEVITLLRKMTLPRFGSMMRKTLRQERFSKEIRVAIARDGISGKYLGWALVSKYWNKTPFVMVFIKPKYRRQGIGTILVRHFKKRGIKFCYRWDGISNSFYNSLGLANVYKN